MIYSEENIAKTIIGRSERVHLLEFLEGHFYELQSVVVILCVVQEVCDRSSL